MYGYVTKLDNIADELQWSTTSILQIPVQWGLVMIKVFAATK